MLTSSHCWSLNVVSNYRILSKDEQGSICMSCRRTTRTSQSMGITWKGRWMPTRTSQVALSYIAPLSSFEGSSEAAREQSLCVFAKAAWGGPHIGWLHQAKGSSAFLNLRNLPLCSFLWIVMENQKGTLEILEEERIARYSERLLMRFTLQNSIFLHGGPGASCLQKRRRLFVVRSHVWDEQDSLWACRLLHFYLFEAVWEVAVLELPVESPLPRRIRFVDACSALSKLAVWLWNTEEGQNLFFFFLQ